MVKCNRYGDRLLVSGGFCGDYCWMKWQLSLVELATKLAKDELSRFDMENEGVLFYVP